MNEHYYIYGKSQRATECEERGGITASRVAKYLQRWFPKIQAQDVNDYFDRSEWHHSSKLFNVVNYFYKKDILAQLSECEFRVGLRNLIARKLKEKKQEILFAEVSWKEWYHPHKRYYNYIFKGEVVKKGDWITFMNEGNQVRKNINGTHLSMNIIDKF